MGYKHTILNKLKFGYIHREKSYRKTKNLNLARKLVSGVTISKLRNHT